MTSARTAERTPDHLLVENGRHRSTVGLLAGPNWQSLGARFQPGAGLAEHFLAVDELRLSFSDLTDTTVDLNIPSGIPLRRRQLFIVLHFSLLTSSPGELSS